MNKDNEKEGVVIDVTPERESESATEPSLGDAGPGEAAPGGAPETSTARPRRGAAGMVAALAVAAIVLVLAGLFFGYTRWSTLQQELTALQARLSENVAQQQQLREAVREADAAVAAQQQVLAAQEARLREGLQNQELAVAQGQQALQAREQQLADEQVRMQEREAELREAVADVHRRIGRSGSQWMVAEAEYLIRLAGHRLTLVRDVTTARAALELADERLKDTLDPSWAGVREQLARDIASLAALDLPDVEGLSARLAALLEQVPQLQLAGADQAQPRPGTPLVDTQTPPAERSWQTLWDDFWGGLKDSVRIRRSDQPVQPMLAPEHQFFLAQNLKLQLEAARLALVRGEPALYRDSLQTARGLLQDYYDPAAAGTRAMAQALDELAAVDLRPELPDVGRALRALKARERLLDDLGGNAPASPPSGTAAAAEPGP
jgi:uroporphyrin-3 C-methyltransferase